MKKFYTTDKYKRKNTIRSKKRLANRTKKKKKRKTFLQNYQSQLLFQNNSLSPSSQYYGKKEEVILIAPNNFSLIENTKEVLKYFEMVENQFKKGRNVFVDMTNVHNISNDTIVLLLAYINNDRILRGCKIKGNSPNDQKSKRVFYESGVFSKPPEGKNRNQILSRRNKKADGKIAQDIVQQATQKLFNEERRCPGVYKALLECMSNTFGHARPKFKGTETWWLSVYNNEEDKHVSFAFIDLGVGIFKSNKMRDFRDKFESFFNIKSNTEILKEILSGRKKSSTKIHYRGKGLPTIYKGIDRNYYSNLQIISNDVKANLSKKKYEDIGKNFSGTFLYWELNENNEWIK